MSLLHPSRRRIRAWFQTGAIDKGLEIHLDRCVRCSDELERVAGNEADVGAALAHLLAPPADLDARMEERIASSFQARRDMQLFGEMFGLGAQTTRLLFEPLEPGPSDGS